MRKGWIDWTDWDQKAADVQRDVPAVSKSGKETLQICLGAAALETLAADAAEKSPLDLLPLIDKIRDTRRSRSAALRERSSQWRRLWLRHAWLAVRSRLRL